MTEALPAVSPLSGVLWTWIVPVALFTLALIATWLLYRHDRDDPDERTERGEDT